MDSTVTTAPEATDASANTDSQAKPAKTYTQEEFDNHMAGLKASLSKKYERQFADLGDIDELRQLKTEAESKRLEDAKKRGEFEKLMQDLATKKDAEIQRRDAVIKEYKVDTPLVNTAAKYRSVNPEQVKSLLKSNVRLNEDGEVEVVGTDGTVRFNDSGKPLGVEELVKEFLDANPHFVQPTPATTNSSHSIRADSGKVDISKLDMRNPEHRKLYAQATGKNKYA
jgi:hypothetical protein